MKREEILKMAQEAGEQALKEIRNSGDPFISEIDVRERQYEIFAKLIAAHEREECAKVCDGKHYYWRWDDEPDSESGPKECAAAIRARK